MADKPNARNQHGNAAQPNPVTLSDGATRHEPANDPTATVPLPPVEVLQATLLFLMSRYARTGCVHLVEAIVQHLRLLESHPDAGQPDGPLQRACRQLAGDWTELRYLRQLRAPSADRVPVTRH